MGWLWTSGDAPKSPPVAPSSVKAEASPTRLQDPPSVNDSPTDHSPSSTPANNDPDAAFLAYLASFEKPPPSPARISKISESRRKTPQDTSSNTSAIITPQSLYPTEISCREAFDTAYHCQSIGGQFANVYRYGTFRDCGEQWRQFWFCLRTNRGFLGDKERAARVKEHYWLRDTKYRVGPSSEDVWRGRGRMLEGAFEGDLDEELRRMDEMKAEVERQGALKE